jgi:hypothetical protein
MGVLKIKRIKKYFKQKLQIIQMSDERSSQIEVSKWALHLLAIVAIAVVIIPSVVSYRAININNHIIHDNERVAAKFQMVESQYKADIAKKDKLLAERDVVISDLTKQFDDLKSKSDEIGNKLKTLQEIANTK